MNIIHNSHSFCRAYFAHNTTSQENRWLKNAILSWFTQTVAQWKHKNMKAVWGRHSTQNRALPGKEQITFLFVLLQLFQLCSKAEAPVLPVLLCCFFHLVKNQTNHTHKKKQTSSKMTFVQLLSKSCQAAQKGGEECKLRIAISSFCSTAGPKTHTTLDLFRRNLQLSQGGSRIQLTLFSDLEVKAVC